MTAVNLPDGRRINFPDSMGEAEISSAIEEIMGGQAAQASGGMAPPATAPRQGREDMAGFEAYQKSPEATLQSLPKAVRVPLQTLRDSVTGIGQGATFNLADEIQAGLATPVEMAREGSLDVGSAYSRGLDKARSNQKVAELRSPVANTVGQVAGGMALGGNVQKSGLTFLDAAKPTIASMAGRGAAEGAAYGATYGFGAGEGAEDRLTKAVSGGVIGAFTGGATGAAGSALANRNASQAITQNAPTMEALETQARAAYQAADQAGVVIKQKAFSDAVDDIAATISREGIDKTLHPRAGAALVRLVEAQSGKGDLTLGDAEILRRVLKSAAATQDPSERRLVSIMTEKLDDFVTNLKPTDVSAGNPEVGVAALKQARQLWHQLSKGDQIETLIELAGSRAGQFSGSGFENALRTEFRGLERNLIKHGNKGFTEAEVAAISKVARGGAIENALRYFGKLAPTGVVSAGSGAGLGYLAAGPAGAVAVPALAIPARMGATAMTKGNAELAAALARAGGNMPAAQLTHSQKALLEALTRGAGQQGHKISP